MKQVLDYLEQLDFSKIEAKLYLKLLELGPMTVAELALVININRTAAYSYIYSLLNKGVIAEVMIGSRKQLVAIDPERLAYLIEKKQESLKVMQNKLPGILTVINSSFIRDKNKEKVEVKYYKGINGIKQIYDDALSGSELRLYATLSEVGTLFPNNPNLFENALSRNTKLRIFEIYGDSIEIIKKFSYTTKNNRYLYKFMPTEVRLDSSANFIYDNKVAIINVKNRLSGIVFHNNEYYNNSKKLFDFIWKVLPES